MGYVLLAETAEEMADEDDEVALDAGAGVLVETAESVGGALGIEDG